MKTNELSKITGKLVKGWYEWLKKEQQGCYSQVYASDGAYDYSVCMGWHKTDDGWEVAWKIGRQSFDNCMQTDLDIDFEMPYDEETGDVDDTLSLVSESPDFDAIAAEMRKQAERVWTEWKDEAET